MRKRRLSSLVLILFLLSGFFPLTAKTVDPKTQLKGFGEFVIKAMAEWKVPGIGVAIVKDGQVILAEGYGLKDVKNNLKVTARTIFAIGSSSKAFTATAAGILADEGKLEWDKPVREYLPAFKLWDLFASERMTPRDLLCHRSGLPRHDLMWIGSPFSRTELFDRLRYLEPNKDFRANFQYQNLMFMTAGHLVGQLSGSTWEDFTARRIFEPLGMKDSSFSVEVSKKSADHALPYAERKDKVVEIPFRNIDAVGPAGSINSTAVDMANWLLLNLGKGKFGGKQVISEASLAQIHSPQVYVDEAVFRLLDNYPEMHPSTYGLGWFITSYRGHFLIHHGGNIDGFSALVSFLPRDNIGVVVLTNLNGTLLTEVATFYAYDRLLGLDPLPWSKRFKEVMDKLKAESEKAKKEADKDRKLNTQPTHSLEEYAGDYAHQGYGVVTFQKDGDKLKALYNGMDFEVSHYHFDVFDLKNEEAFADLAIKATFDLDLKGNVTAVAIPLQASVKPIVFERMPEKKMMERSFLEKFLGQYELQGVVFTVQLRGENTLVVVAPGQPEMELVPYRGTEFNIKSAPGASLEFIVEASGTVNEVKFKQAGAVMTAKRKQ